MNRITRHLVATVLAALLANGTVSAQDASRASAGASRDLSIVTGSIVLGSASVLAAGSGVTIQALEKVGDSVVIVLKSASEAGSVSVRVAASTAGVVSLAVGQTITVVVEASGYVLQASGKVIAFIPNEIGKSLVHHSRVEATRGDK